MAKPSGKTSKPTKQGNGTPVGSGASLTDAATGFLRDRILDLTLSPGERLDEKMLFERFSLSRTPVREALNRLIAEGLVEVKSNRGAFVAGMDLKHTMDLLTAYVMCERMVASSCNLEDEMLATDLSEIQDRYEETAANRKLLNITETNSEFHRRIAQATGNQFIMQFSADLHNLARRISFFVYQKEQYSTGEIVLQISRINGQHRGIIDIISNKDRAGLVVAMAEHASVFRERLFDVMSKGQGEDVDFLALDADA